MTVALDPRIHPKIFTEDKMNAQVIYNFPELTQRINDLSPTIIQLINQHNLNGLQQIVASYDQSVTVQYADHDDYDFTPSIGVDLMLPIIGQTVENYALSLGWTIDDITNAVE